MQEKNPDRLSITMPENVSRLVTMEAARRGKSKNSIIIEAIVAYFKRPVNSTSTGIQFNENSSSEQFTILSDRLDAVYSMLSGVYRSTAYVAQLETQKSDGECKRIARKKAMNDYSKMKTNQLSREEFLIESFPEEFEEDDKATEELEEVNQTTSDILTVKPSTPTQPTQPEPQKPKFIFNI